MTTEHNHQHDSGAEQYLSVLTIRPHSGLAGDIFLTGLAALNMQKLGLEPDSQAAGAWLGEMAGKILPELANCARLDRVQINGIGGWRARIDLPHAHEHRNLADITGILEAADLPPKVRESARQCFEIVARSESRVHARPLMDIHFHEVGALDSILDICLTCFLFHDLAPDLFICGPLPMADGSIQCAHGVLPAPAPAVLEMLKGVPVRPFPGSVDAGELVTPTALALLGALHATYGPWPEFTPEYTAIAYGGKVFANAPNGALFALGCARRH